MYYDGIWTICKAPFFGKKESKLELVLKNDMTFLFPTRAGAEHMAHPF